MKTYIFDGGTDLRVRRRRLKSVVAWTEA